MLCRPSLRYGIVNECKTRDKLVLLLASAITGLVFSCNVSADYVGAESCKSCHSDAYDAWQTSDHFKAMAVANEDTVAGAFDGKPLIFHDLQTRFYLEDGQHKVETDIGDGPETFDIEYTFGHSPLQQYIVDIGKGHLQVLNVAWDSRPESEGGERWFHLQPDEDIEPDHPFFWARHFQNWNSRCADCHSTGVERNYDPVNHAYDTTFKEINVACEACHGPGADHVAAGGGKGNIFNAPREVSWSFAEGDSIANPSGTPSDAMVDMCGGCHSRRSIVAPLSPGENYHDQYRLTLLEENFYHADGQIQDEVFVLGSFMQSKMHGQGVTCSNCHEPHSGKLVLQGNNLCAQCHEPATYDSKQHHFHEMSETAPSCNDCHMPETTYMQVDDRADHRFGIPHRDPTSELPTACLDCHEAIPAAEGFSPAALEDSYAKLMTRLRLGDTTAFRSSLELMMTGSLSNIELATLINTIVNPIPLPLLERYAEDEDPMIRRIAALALGELPFEESYPLLSKLATDDVSTVRHNAARTLANHLGDLPLEDMGFVIGLMDEYRASLDLNADSPGNLTQLGTLELSLGRMREAEKAYIRALSIEPMYLPAMLNYADMQRALGDEKIADAVLAEAVGFAPDSGAANFAYALSLIRQDKIGDAMGYLKAATEQADAVPRYAYVYAVALDSEERTTSALDVLAEANATWPNQFESLLLEALLMEKSGDTSRIKPVIRKLRGLAPGHPEVRRRVEHYLNEGVSNLE